MMKSMFLSDSRVLDNTDTTTTTLNQHASSNSGGSDNDNEYIMVDCTPSFDYDADTNCSEEEYDYCDDAISEGMQSDQGGYTCSFTFSLTEDMILEGAEQPSIQHILDEAHKSASQLVSITEQDPDLDEHPHPNLDDDNSHNLNQVPGILESSASDVSVQSTPPPPLPAPERKISSESSHPVSSDIVTQVCNVAGIESESSESGRASSEPQADSTTVKQPQQHQCLLGGRMSNKKRRKKMKLLKKAAAAAKAAAALSCDIPQSANTTTICSSSSSVGKPSTKKTTAKASAPPTRYQSKRVANVAVACATETLASYKAELKASSNKKNH